MDKEEIISQARELRKNDELEASQELLLELLAKHAKDPLVLYEVGGAFDVLGEEQEAIPYYSKAIDAGLEGDDLQECYICLGMCHRNTGDFETAVSILKKAVQKFPERNSIKAFLALAEYSDAQEDEAMRILLELLITTTKDEDILTFADTLDFYKDNLDEVWDE